MLNRKFFGAMSAVVMGFGAMVSSTFGGTILDFGTQPASPVTPELIWTGSALTVGAGAVGNGDGALPLASQVAPGLQLVTPYTVPGVTGSAFSGGGETTFYDATLELTGLNAAAPAISTVIYPGYSIVTQVLSAGTFSFWNTDHTTLLLGGTIDFAAITGPIGSSVGGVGTIDLAVTYTSGAILDAANAVSGTGQFSWSLLDITPSLAVVGAQAPALREFSANLVGQFTGSFIPVPEPASLALMGVAGLALIRRRKA